MIMMKINIVFTIILRLLSLFSISSSNCVYGKTVVTSRKSVVNKPVVIPSRVVRPNTNDRFRSIFEEEEDEEDDHRVDPHNDNVYDVVHDVVVRHLYKTARRFMLDCFILLLLPLSPSQRIIHKTSSRRPSLSSH